MRQKAVRHDGGRPSSGMRPGIFGANGEEIAAAITVLLIESDPEAMTDMLQHIARKTHDPRQRVESALRILSSSYYQDPENFSDRMTASFSPDSGIVTTLVRKNRCVLHFQQHRQAYRVPCTIHELAKEDTAWQATYWHNFLFNPTLSQVRILGFSPDWNKASASPEIPQRAMSY